MGPRVAGACVAIVVALLWATNQPWALVGLPGGGGPRTTCEGVLAPDFLCYYAASAVAARGRDPYACGKPFTFSLRSACVTQTPDPFLYPPSFLLLFRPYGRCAYVLALRAWTLLGVAALALCALGNSHTRGVLPFVLFVGLSLGSRPFFDQLHTGQADCLVAALSIGAFVAHKRGMSALGGVVLAVAALLKAMPALLLVYFVGRHRDGRFAVSFGLFAAVGVALSVWFVPAAEWGRWAAALGAAAAEGGGWQRSQSFARLARECGHAGLVAHISPVCLGILGLFLCLRRPRTGTREIADLSAFLLAVVVCLLSASLTWSQTYVWTLVPLAELLPLFVVRLPRHACVAACATALIHLGNRQGLKVAECAPTIGAALLAGCLVAVVLCADVDKS